VIVKNVELHNASSLDRPLEDLLHDLYIEF